MITCEWLEAPHLDKPNICADEGKHILIYGCIQGHIGEHIFCQHHLFQWEEIGLNDSAWCPKDNCSNHTIEWTITPIGTATMGWLHKHIKERTW